MMPAAIFVVLSLIATRGSVAQFPVQGLQDQCAHLQEENSYLTGTLDQLESCVQGCLRNSFFHQTDCEPGILAYYPLDNDFKDHCNAFHATPQGGVSIDHATGQNGAAKFDGTGKLVVDFFRLYQWGTAFSVSVWFKRTGGFTTYSGIVNNGYHATGSWEIRMGRSGSTYLTHEEFGCGVVTANSPATWDFLNVPRRATPGITPCCSGPILARNTPVTIGQAGPGTVRNPEFFTGLIDDVRLYGKVLSTEEIAALYTRAYERATYGLRESNFTILTCNCCTDSARSTYVPRTVLASSVLTPHFPVDLLNDHAEHTCTISVYKDNLTGDCQLVSKMPRKAQKKTTRQDPKKRAAEDTRAASDDEVIRRCTHLQRATIAQRSFVVSTYNSPLAQRTMHATADGQACRADHVRTPCATVRVTYSLGRPPYVCRKNVADVATTKTGPQDVPHSPAGRTALSHRTYRTLPQNVPHSPAERTALSHRTYRTLPLDVPHSPAQRTALSHRTYRTLPQNVPHSPAERTALSHRTYRTLPQDVPHSPAERTALSSRTYRTLQQNVPHSPAERTALSRRTYRTLQQNVPHSPAERTALSRRTYRTLPQNVPHSPAGRTALSRTTYRTLPQNVPHSPAQRTALSRRTNRTLPQNVPHSPAERTVLSRRTYRTLPQNVPYSPAERTALSRRTYRTLPQNVPYSPAERTALSRRTYRTLPQNVPHSPAERPSKIEAYFVACGLKVQLALVLIAAIVWQSEAYWRHWRQPVWPREYCDFPPTGEGIVRKNCSWPYRNGDTCKLNVGSATRGDLATPAGTADKASGADNPWSACLNVESCTYICRKGYSRVYGDSTITCRNGTWSGMPLTCKYTGCRRPPYTRHGLSRDCQWPYENGKNCTYTCRDGYSAVSGSTTITCVNGHWSRTPLQCRRTCTRGAWGPYTCRSPYEEGETCSYRCLPGFRRLHGETSRTCTGGRWTGGELFCIYTGRGRTPVG
ncbi:hypothetical protein Bbelb_359720 [Branchiostoma belcheri]|nr:hypothetical protein Bbelb_359720 [Branchiostoma belcheri]